MAGDDDQPSQDDKEVLKALGQIEEANEATEHAAEEAIHEAEEHQAEAAPAAAAAPAQEAPQHWKLSGWHMIYFLMGIFIHIIDAFVGSFTVLYFRILGYFFIMTLFYAILCIGNPRARIFDQDPWANFRGALWLNFWAILVPTIVALWNLVSNFITGNVPFAQNVWHFFSGAGTAAINAHVWGAIFMFFPVYVWAFIILGPYEGPFLSRFKKWIMVFWGIVIVIQLFLWVSWANQYGALDQIPFLQEYGEGLKPANAFDALWGMIKQTGIGIGTFVTQTYQSVVLGTQAGLREATGGDLFAGKVDRNAELDLGVRFETLETTDPIVSLADPLDIFGTLIIAPIEDEEDPQGIIAEVSCYIGSGNNKTRWPADVVRPDTTIERIEAYSYEEVDVDCGWDQITMANEVKGGPRTISAFADFNFNTLGYLKGYTIEQELSRALRRERVDIFDQYGIEDKNPVAIYTNGPVMIGMDPPRLPIEIDRTGLRNEFVLGISVKNRWPGQIKEITSFKLILPDGMELAVDDQNRLACGDLIFTQSGIATNEYAATPASIKEEFENLITGKAPHKTLRCTISIPANEVDNVLGNIPVETKFFKVDVGYKYQVEKTLSVNVQVPADFVVPETALGVIRESNIFEDTLVRDGEEFQYDPNSPNEKWPKRATIRIAGTDAGGSYEYRYVFIDPQGNTANNIDTGWLEVPESAMGTYVPNSDDVIELLGSLVTKIQGQVARFEYPLDGSSLKPGRHRFFARSESSHQTEGDTVSVSWTISEYGEEALEARLASIISEIESVLSEAEIDPQAQIDQARTYIIERYLLGEDSANQILETLQPEEEEASGESEVV